MSKTNGAKISKKKTNNNNNKNKIKLYWF